MAHKDTLVTTPRFRGRGFEVDPNLVFVLIPFRTPFTEIFADHIQKVVSEFGLIARKADDIFAPREIMEDIWEQINRARFIIADLTGKNPNVFYEIGIAHTIGKEVILIAQSEEDVPFDLRHIRYFRYEHTPRGMQSFENDLRRTIAELLSADSIADPWLLEFKTMLNDQFTRWDRLKEAGVVRPPFDAIIPPTLVTTLSAFADRLNDVLDESRLAFMLQASLWYGIDTIYWAEKNRENEKAVPVLLDTLQRPERRPFYRAGLALEYLSPSLRHTVIEQAQEQLEDNERMTLVLEKAEKGETLDFWENELSQILDPGLVKELIYQAKTSRRVEQSK